MAMVRITIIVSIFIHYSLDVWCVEDTTINIQDYITEYAGEVKELGHGIFKTALLEGLSLNETKKTDLLKPWVYMTT